MNTKSTIHDLTEFTMSEAYDETQCGDIKSGDFMVCRDGVAVMFESWPAMIIGTSSTFHNFDDTPKYVQTKAEFLAAYRAAAAIEMGA